MSANPSVDRGVYPDEIGAVTPKKDRFAVTPKKDRSCLCSFTFTNGRHCRTPQRDFLPRRPLLLGRGGLGAGRPLSPSLRPSFKPARRSASVLARLSCCLPPGSDREA